MAIQPVSASVDELVTGVVAQGTVETAVDESIVPVDMEAAHVYEVLTDVEIMIIDVI